VTFMVAFLFLSVGLVVRLFEPGCIAAKS
jgi:hypothetical protein